MRFYKIFIITTAASLVVCIAAQIVQAQNAYDKALIESLLRAEEDLARMMGAQTRKDPNEYRFISRALRGKPMQPGPERSSPPPRLPPSQDFSEVIARVPVTQHFVGDSGTALDIDGQNEAPSLKSSPEPFKHFQQGLKQASQVLSHIPPLPLCERSASLKEQVKQRSQAVHNDILLYRETRGMPALSGRFGKNVTLVQCLNQEGDVCARSALMLNLRCLPTRIRTSGKTVFRLEGASALRNFDKKLHGEVTPEIQEVIPMLLGGDR